MNTETFKSSATLVTGDTFRHMFRDYTVTGTPVMAERATPTAIERYEVPTNAGVLLIPSRVMLKVV